MRQAAASASRCECAAATQPLCPAACAAAPIGNLFCCGLPGQMGVHRGRYLGPRAPRPSQADAQTAPTERCLPSSCRQGMQGSAGWRWVETRLVECEWQMQCSWRATRETRSRAHTDLRLCKAQRSQNRAPSREVSTRAKQSIIQWQSAPEHARRLQQRGKVGGLHLAPLHGQAHSMHIARSMCRRSTKSAPAGRGAGAGRAAPAAASAVVAAAWQCLKQLAHTSSQAAQARQLGTEGRGRGRAGGVRVADQRRHPPSLPVNEVGCRHSSLQRWPRPDVQTRQPSRPCADLIRQIQQLGECVDEGEQHKGGVADELCQLAAVALGCIACGRMEQVARGGAGPCDIDMLAAKAHGRQVPFQWSYERDSGADGTPAAPQPAHR